MFYFKDLKTLRIVLRNFQYNMEAIDGKIVEIPPTAEGLLIAHVPNKLWNYDVNIIEKGEIEELIKKLDPLPQKSNEPKVFYAVILETDFETYVTDYGFRKLPSKIKTSKSSQSIISPEPQKHSLNKLEPSQLVSDFDYLPSLDRTQEKTVHKFVSPSERYK